jgi:hypothetical protein
MRLYLHRQKITMAAATRTRSFHAKTQIYDNSLVKMERLLLLTTEYIRRKIIVTTLLVSHQEMGKKYKLGDTLSTMELRRQYPRDIMLT